LFKEKETCENSKIWENDRAYKRGKENEHLYTHVEKGNFLVGSAKVHTKSLEQTFWGGCGIEFRS
jgi:hypothetical protein